jgi:hypothetical protein
VSTFNVHPPLFGQIVARLLNKTVEVEKLQKVTQYRLAQAGKLVE